MYGNFRIAGCTRSEIHKHCIVATGRILGTVKATGIKAIFFIKVSPALAAAVNHNLMLKSGALLCRQINLFRNLAVGGTKNSFDSCGLNTVGYIMLF